MDVSFRQRRQSMLHYGTSRASQLFVGAQPESEELWALATGEKEHGNCIPLSQVGSMSVFPLLSRSEVKQRMLALEQRLAGMVQSMQRFDIQPKKNSNTAAPAGNERVSNRDEDSSCLSNNPAKVSIAVEENHNQGESLFLHVVHRKLCHDLRGRLNGVFRDSSGLPPGCLPR